jgi:hypothetical protein
MVDAPPGEKVMVETNLVLHTRIFGYMCCLVYPQGQNQFASKQTDFDHHSGNGAEQKVQAMLVTNVTNIARTFRSAPMTLNKCFRFC